VETGAKTEAVNSGSFAGWGCQLLFTESIEEMKSLFPALKLAAVVLDMSNDPEMTVPLLREIAVQNRRGTEVIVILSGTNLETAQRIQRSGVTEILIKPFPGVRLKNAVMGACSRAESKGDASGKSMVLMLQCPVPTFTAPVPAKEEATSELTEADLEIEETPDATTEMESEKPEIAENSEETPPTS
jgi:DNA-binding response OmpR family regulator